MNRIQELRKRDGVSLAKLSKILKDSYSITASPQTIMRYEQEKTQPKLDVFESIANHFSVSVPYLQGISDENGTLFRTVADFVSSTDYRSFDLLDNSVQITINGKNVSASDIEKIREYAMFITKSD